jgi:hypothetical protein
MYLSMQTIEAILRLASPFIRRTGTESSFTLLLSVQEGVACRFAASTWTDQILSPLAPELISEIGWKTIEHSSRRQVVVRCSVPNSEALVANAEIDRGFGFEPLLVIASTQEPG